jgi:chemotaxis protein MotB
MNLLKIILLILIFVSNDFMIAQETPEQQEKESAEEEANDWFYYRSEYRELLKKKKLADKDYFDLKIKSAKEIAEFKKENDLLRERLIALENDINNTRESKLLMTRESDVKYLELENRISTLEAAKKNYEDTIENLKKEKEDLAKKLEIAKIEKEQAAAKLAAMENLIDHLKKDRDQLEFKLSATDANYQKVNLDNIKNIEKITTLEVEKKNLQDSLNRLQANSKDDLQIKESKRIEDLQKEIAILKQEQSASKIKYENLDKEYKFIKDTLSKESSGDDSKKLADLQKELDRLKKEKLENESLIKSGKDKIASLENERLVMAQNIQLSPSNENLDQLKLENKNLKSEIEKSNKELEKLKKENQDSYTGKLKEEVEILTREYKEKTRKLIDQLTHLQEREEELSLENERLKTEIDRLNARTKSDLENKLKNEIASGDMSIQQVGSRVIINLYDTITFNSGSAVLKKPGKKLIYKITDALKNYPNRKIYIEGNTDNVPIAGGKFKDNWELSAARAITVLRYLIKSKSIPSQNLVAVGNSEFNPLKPNSTNQNKSLNRRVDIVILPEMSTTPIPAN